MWSRLRAACAHLRIAAATKPWTRQPASAPGTLLVPAAASAPGLWGNHRRHSRVRTGLSPATSVLGPCTPQPKLRQNRAHPCPIRIRDRPGSVIYLCTGADRAHPCDICTRDAVPSPQRNECRTTKPHASVPHPHWGRPGSSASHLRWDRARPCHICYTIRHRDEPGLTPSECARNRCQLGRARPNRRCDVCTGTARAVSAAGNSSTGRAHATSALGPTGLIARHIGTTGTRARP